jgi:EmrB/QacA subfamily drug resistance transporter
VEQHRWWTLGVVCVAIFMLLLDITVVNVALPDIQRDLGATFDDLQWVIDAYALTLAALLLTAGSLADRLGRRAVFTAGLALFIAASLLCGLSTTPTMLNLSRGLQGVGGAVMFACSLALIAQAFPPRERGTAFGIFGATTGAAVAIGPLVGGALTESLGWEWIFFVNVPIGLLAIVATRARVAEGRDPGAGAPDLGGLVTWSSALFLLVFALVRGNSEGWGSPLIVGFLAGAAVLLAAFVAVELRSDHPMFDLTLFRNPSFSGAAIVAFALSASMFSMFLYLTLYMQNILGYGPLDAGLRFLPFTLLSFVVAPIAGKLTERVPVRALLGTGLVCVGTGLLLMTAVDADSGWEVLLPGFVIAGAGVGMVNPPLVATQVGVVAPQRSGMASGIGNTFRQVGIATGIAGLGAVFQHLVAEKTIAALGRGAAPSEQALASGRLDDAPAPLQEALRTGFTGALDEILVIAAVVAFAGALAGYALVRSRDFHPVPEPAPAAA